MDNNAIACVCGKNAEMVHLPVHKVFMIKCECGKRTAADTVENAVRFWRELCEMAGDNNDVE